MIEQTLISYLSTALSVPVSCEVPEVKPASYVVIERTGGYRAEHLNYSTFAIKSYAASLEGAMLLDGEVIEALLAITTLPEIASSRLNSHYNYTDTTTKEYRYQAVFDFVHY